MYIDTHCHLDGEEFAEDRDEVVQRAREAGCSKIFLPAIDAKSCQTVVDTCNRYPDYCYPMLGLHPEEVKSDWREQLATIKEFIVQSQTFNVQHPTLLPLARLDSTTIGAVSLRRSRWKPSKNR